MCKWILPTRRLKSAFQNRCEGSVGAVFVRLDLDGFSDFKSVVLGKSGNQAGVFRIFDRAGGINDAATRFQAGQGILENLCLDFCKILDVGGLESPADVDPSADDAGVRARNVEQDCVEGFMKPFRGGLAPVVDGNLIGLDAEAGEVLLKPREALFVGIGAGEAVAPAERRGDEESLSAGSGAGIEDFFTGLGCEEIDAVTGCWILDVDVAACEELSWEFPFEPEIVRCVPERLSGDFGIGG